ncbi:NUDIX hydrolase [Streptomyces sp. NPDC058335]|uniref:NUDIX hydrolase n=1 Tax=Streptomyces sp. NPDC058335 TaxID=3346451 RepID=UPI0036505355
MSEASARPLAFDSRGSLLVSFTRGEEGVFPGDAPMPMALTALWHQDEVVMVHDRYRDSWELPGGMLEPGETPRQAAVRELFEECGQDAHGPLVYVGHAGFLVAPDRRAEYGALFTGRALHRQAFEGDQEISEARWWDLESPLPGRVSGIDVYLARLTRGVVPD